MIIKLICIFFKLLIIKTKKILICGFCNKTAKVDLDDNSKSIVRNAFTKINQNYIKLEYFISLDTSIDYYNYYNKYNPELDNPELESDCDDTDVTENNNSNNNFSDSD